MLSGCWTEIQAGQLLICRVLLRDQPAIADLVQSILPHLAAWPHRACRTSENEIALPPAGLSNGSRMAAQWARR
jgi:hypothetical protein